MSMKSKSGLTLVEAILAVLVLCVATAGSALVVVASGKVSDQARDHYVAVNIAHNRIERAKTINYSNLTSLQETGTVVNVDGDTADPVDSGMYMRTTQVNVIDSVKSLSELVVTVSIRNRVSLAFTNETEKMTCMFTAY